MKQHPVILLLAAAATCLVAGCSDPADKVHKSSASEPRKTGSVPSPSGKEYVIRAESTIGFVGSKVTGSHHGGFKNFSGKINVAGGRIVGAPEIKIRMQSIWADNNRLEGHLKSADFFGVDQFPVATFAATVIEASGAQHKV